jgi:hypothetical protein
VVAKGIRYLRGNALGALALFVALGGTGYAATGGFSQGGALKACVNEEGRVKLLRSGQHCRRGQKSVSWNQTGPQGAKGASGAAGAAGATGPVGPSHVFEVSRELSGVLPKSTKFELKTIATLDVPPGIYAATATATVEDKSTTLEEEVICHLDNAQTGDEGSTRVTLVPGGALRDITSVAMNASATLPSGGTWRLRCSTESPEVQIEEIRIQAIQVGAATKSALP